MKPTPLHPQAINLLAAAGVTVEPAPDDPTLWRYRLPSGQQGYAESEMQAAVRALGHLRTAVVDLQALVDVLQAEIAQVWPDDAEPPDLAG